MSKTLRLVESKIWQRKLQIAMRDFLVNTIKAYQTFQTDLRDYKSMEMKNIEYHSGKKEADQIKKIEENLKL